MSEHSEPGDQGSFNETLLAQQLRAFQETGYSRRKELRQAKEQKLRSSLARLVMVAQVDITGVPVNHLFDDYRDQTVRDTLKMQHLRSLDYEDYRVQLVGATVVSVWPGTLHAVVAPPSELEPVRPKQKVNTWKHWVGWTFGFDTIEHLAHITIAPTAVDERASAEYRTLDHGERADATYQKIINARDYGPRGDAYEI